MTVWQGYRRPDGRVGLRNHLLILPTVVCANQVCARVAEMTPGAVAIPHPYGCSQVGEDARRTFSVLTGLGRHPNVGAVLVVGLGCEALQSEDVAQAIAASGKPVEVLSIQEVGGSIRAIQEAAARAERLVAHLATLQPEPICLSDLWLALVEAGVDRPTAETANPAVGRVVERLLNAGGTVLFGQVSHLLGSEGELATRCLGQQVAETALAAVRRWTAGLQRHGLQLPMAAGGGSVAAAPPVAQATAHWQDSRWAAARHASRNGGVRPPELPRGASLARLGQAPVAGVVDYAQPPGGAGAWLMETPADDVEAVTGLVAAGAQAVLYTTGNGLPTGSPVAPVVKISATAEVCQRFADHIDVDLSDLSGAGPSLPAREEGAARILRALEAVAGGHLTKAEWLGHQEFVVTRAGITL